MAIFAANRALQLSLRIQSRNPPISSLGRKGYGTSGPVRYVPKIGSPFKKHQKARPLENSDEKDGILAKNGALSKRVAQELPKFDDRKGQDGISRDKNSKSNAIFKQVEEFMELKDANISPELINKAEVGSVSELIINEVSNCDGDRSSEGHDLLSRNIRQDAEKLAIELLAVRAFTELELRKKLLGKKYSPKIVDPVVTDIRSRGLLNDGLYAESFSRSRWLSLTWGPKRIKQVLFRKGVNGKEAEAALKQVFEGDDADGDGKTLQHGMSKSSLDRLFLQASKQWLRGLSTSPENRKTRIVRWLQYRGFNWGVTNTILKKLEAQYPP